MKYQLVQFEALLQKAEKTGFGKAETAGKTKEGIPIYSLTVTDFSVPDENKYHILIAGLHVGGERAALRASYSAIEWLLKPGNRKKYLADYAVTFMPAVNPYGCFYTDIDQQHVNTSGLDPYTGDHGKCFSYPDLALVHPETSQELTAFLQVVDKLKPEIMLDWHGANGNSDDETMRETLGASLSNHLIMPWGTRLLAAMRKEICKGNSAVFDLEEYLERIPAPVEIQEKIQNRFRPSSAFFYPDLYSYVKYHTMPIVMEIGQAETGWRALKGLLDYGLRHPEEYQGFFPVDHIGVDFGNLVIHSYGQTPGERRISRAELQQKQDGMLTFYLGPMYIGRAGAVLCMGQEGVREMVGDVPLRQMGEHAASEFPCGGTVMQKALKAGREKWWLPLMTKYHADNLPEMEAPQHGMTLQMFLPIGHTKKVTMTSVLLNNRKLASSSTDGYELVQGTDGWHLFLHFPPSRTRKEKLYAIVADYAILG